MARSLTETLTEAARAAVDVSEWERDREAWNLPRAQAGALPDEAGEGEADAGEGDPQQDDAEPPAPPPESMQ